MKEVKVALGDANFLKVCLIESVGGCVVGHYLPEDAIVAIMIHITKSMI